MHMYSSIVIGGEKLAQSAGFEPARAEPNGFLVHRLNHSATTARCKSCFLTFLGILNELLDEAGFEPKGIKSFLNCEDNCLIIRNSIFPISFLYAVVAEWLRRWTRNPLGSARTGSNPVGSEYFEVYTANFERTIAV